MRPRSLICLIPLVSLVLALAPGPMASASTRWRAPLEGRLTVLWAFAPGAQQWSPGHRGVDLAAGPGDPVLAAGPGSIVYAGDLAGRGVVSIDHGGLRTTYEPVDSTVRVGQWVEAGQMLGRIAGSGSHCPCLHWGLKRDRTYLDPMSLLRRVVLKPA